MENIIDIRAKRSELDIETLRNTQHDLLDHYDGIYKMMAETHNIATENRERLNRLEELALENRAILLAIADHLDLIYEKPDTGSEPHPPAPSPAS